MRCDGATVINNLIKKFYFDENQQNNYVVDALYREITLKMILINNLMKKSEN